MQPHCATAKREKSRRRGTLPCGKLPGKEKGRTQRCAKSPADCQNASQSLRPQAQMEFKSFLPATCASAKILLGSQTCERSECAAASRDPLKWESPAGLSHLNIKKAHPKVRPLRNAVGVRLEPARLGRWVAARSLPRFQRPAKSREACNSRPEIGVPYI